MCRAGPQSGGYTRLYICNRHDSWRTGCIVAGHPLPSPARRRSSPLVPPSTPPSAATSRAASPPWRPRAAPSSPRGDDGTVICRRRQPQPRGRVQDAGARPCLPPASPAASGRAAPLPAVLWGCGRLPQWHEAVRCARPKAGGRGGAGRVALTSRAARAPRCCGSSPPHRPALPGRRPRRPRRPCRVRACGAGGGAPTGAAPRGPTGGRPPQPTRRAVLPSRGGG